MLFQFQQKAARFSRHQQKLSAFPTFGDIQKCFLEAVEHCGRPVSVIWKNDAADDTDYRLTVYRVNDTRQARWEVHLLSAFSTELLLSESSGDVPMMYNVLLSVCQSSDKEAMELDGLMSVNESQRSSSKKYDQFYEKSMSAAQGDGNALQTWMNAQASKSIAPKEQQVSLGSLLAEVMEPSIALPPAVSQVRESQTISQPLAPIPAAVQADEEAHDDTMLVSDYLKRDEPMMNPNRAKAVQFMDKLAQAASANASPDSPAKAPTQLAPKHFDMNMLDQVKAFLTDRDTGLMTFAGFLFMLEQEYKRTLRCNGGHFTLMVIQLDHSLDALQREQILAKAMKAKRGCDVLSHYDSSRYIFLLPQTSVKGATKFAKRLINAFGANAASFGIASLSTEVANLRVLLAAADNAVECAIAASQPIYAYAADAEAQQELKAMAV